jgi:hypothetical protein
MYICVPSHSETITFCTAVTLLEFKSLAGTRGLEVQEVFHSSPVISHLRNIMVADFLASGADVLFMLDSDQGLPPQTIWRMLESGHPVVGCIYPRRSFRWPDVPPDLSSSDMKHLLYHATHWVGEIEVRPDGSFQIHNGFARATSVGSGAMLIRRHVIEVMQARFPELKGQGFPNESENLPREAYNWGFFNQMVAATDGYNTGADIAFCVRWRNCGGEIWADIVSETVHVGRYQYRGNYLEYLRRKGVVQLNH